MQKKEFASLDEFASLEKAPIPPKKTSAQGVAYAELRCKTNFSFLEGASHPEEVVQQAKALGLSALAVTDRNGVYGIVRAHTAAKDAGLPLIIGSEITLSDATNASTFQPKGPRSSLVLLAQSRKGYAALCRLISKAKQERPKGEILVSIEDIASHAYDLFALAPTPSPSASATNLSIEDTLAALREIFGDRLFLLLHRTLEASDRSRSKEAIRLSTKLSLPIVATNDVHYHLPSRQPLQDVLTAIRCKTTVEAAGFLLFPNAERRLKSPKEMARLFSDLPGAIERTVEIAQACRFSLDELHYTYPNEFLPPGKTADEHLADLTWEGAKRTYRSAPESVASASYAVGSIPDAVRAQLEHELALIRQLRFADYFLTIHDIVTFARSRNILCQGRGSAANSAVCYVLGITAIDPIRMDLLFERFLSAERGEPPDIDIDFEHERREEVIQYIYERYDRSRAGMVAEVICYRQRSALREVGKALGMPHAEANRLAKAYHWRDHKKINPVFLKEVKASKNPRLVQNLLNLTQEIEGFPRHLSTHVGGFVLTQDPLNESVPIERARMEGRTIIQWDKNDLDAIGMLKVDVLGLGILTAIRKCLDMVNSPPRPLPPSFRSATVGGSRPEAGGEGSSPEVGAARKEGGLNGRGGELTLSTIPAEDPKVYEMIGRADTVGVFQIESRAQMGMLPRLQPRSFHDLVTEVAIVRPGPIQGGMIHPFLRRRRGEEPIRYAHPSLEPILKKTFGIPLFQEQVMKIAVAVADFTPGEADELRRAMGIWRTSTSKSIRSLAEKLIERMLKNGISQEDALLIFKQIESFGEFGFPESHSASFALLVYASAYLKCYHPEAFACALINSLPMGFYSPHTILDDARRHGIEIRPVDVLRSDWDLTLEKKTIRLGFRLVRALREENVKLLCNQRMIQPFKSLEDVVARSGFNSRELFYLAAADAFSPFGLDRREALWKLAALAPVGTPPARVGTSLDAGKSLPEPAVSFPSLTPVERVTTDYQVLGTSTFAHPAWLLRKELTRAGAVCADEIVSLPPGKIVRAGGMVIVRQSPPTAKGMVFLTLEDETGFINGAISPPMYEKLRETLNGASFLLVEGKLQRDGWATSLLLSRVWPIPLAYGGFPDTSRNFH